jgi:hypothetical protein
MRPSLLSMPAVGLAFLLLVPAASAGPGLTGPFAGLVVEGQTNAHLFSSYPPGLECILPVTWVVTLHYAPTSDVLGLEARGVSAVGHDGFAQVSFEDSCSTSFVILVSGVDVALLATYTVDVHSGAAGA